MNHSSPGPARPVVTANAEAWSGVMALRTRGRVRVRAICASNGTSWSWLKELAEAEHKAVPMAVERRMGTVVGSGERATPHIEVSMTRTVSRDLESCE